MQFVTENTALQSNLLRCVKKYQRVSFATAWATANTRVFQELVSDEIEIERAVIGTHFFQTHPDVLKVFVEDLRVRFALQPTGVFHPKILVFWDKSGWEAFVGSANLTKGALTSNSEAVILVSRADTGSDELKVRMLEAIGGYWDAASPATEVSAERYRELWELRQPTLRRLSGEYGSDPGQRTPVESDAMSMSWREFYAAAREEKEHGFRERCGFLDVVGAAFRDGRRFHEMEPDLRRMIAGLPSARDDRWGWFGSMRGNGKFWAAVNNNDIHLSLALDVIPLEGPVPRSLYYTFLEEFLKAFPGGRGGLATATRLLAMKRPDEFVCFDKMNETRLCADFGIKASGMDHRRYWDEVVERIRDAPWWNSPQPAGDLELSAWRGRAAMLDAIFYVYE